MPGEPLPQTPKAAPGGWREAIEAAAKVADAEAASMKRVAEFHQPPRVDGDNYIADLHDQGEIVAQRIAASIRAMSIGLHEPKAAPGGWREAIEAAALLVERRRNVSTTMPALAKAIRALASPPDAAPGGWREAFAAGARAMQEVAEVAALACERPPNSVRDRGYTDGCRDVAEAIADLPLPPPPEDKGRAGIAAEVPEGDGGEDVELTATRNTLAFWMRHANQLREICDEREQALAASRAARDECERQFQEQVARVGELLDELAASRAEVEELRPYRDELLEIAAELGEPNDPFAAWEALAASRARADALAGALEKALSELEHAAVFVGSRERIHPTGMALYGAVVKECRAALAAHAGSKGAKS